MTKTLELKDRLKVAKKEYIETDTAYKNARKTFDAYLRAKPHLKEGYKFVQSKKYRILPPNWRSWSKTPYEYYLEAVTHYRKELEQKDKKALKLFEEMNKSESRAIKAEEEYFKLKEQYEENKEIDLYAKSPVMHEVVTSGKKVGNVLKEIILVITEFVILSIPPLVIGLLF